MNEKLFLEKMTEIYGFVGKKCPEMPICKAIFNRVKTLPDVFMDFCIRHFQDREDLPKNMGAYLIGVLWPEFLEKNPQLKSFRDVICCPKCTPDIPGFRKIYDKTGYCHVIRCTCGNAANPKRERIFTDQELLSWGYVFKQPIKASKFSKEYIQELINKKWLPERTENLKSGISDNDTRNNVF